MPIQHEDITEQHELERLQCTLLAALSQLGDTASSADIQALETHPDFLVRRHIVAAAVDDARRRGRDYVKVFGEFFNDARQEVRESAVQYATHHADEKLIPTMASLFYTDTAPAVDKAATVAAVSAEAKLVTAERELHALRDGWAHRTARDFVLACRSQDAACIDPVLAAVADPCCPVAGRVMAVEALGYAHDIPQVVRGLLEALDSTEEALHGRAASSLSWVRDGAALLHELEARLESDRTNEVKHHVLYAIARLAERYPERCTPILESYLDRHSYQGAAVEGLRRANARQDVPRLRTLYESLRRK